MLEQFATWFGAVVMIMGIVCVVVGHSVNASKWVKHKLNKHREVHHGQRLR